MAIYIGAFASSISALKAIYDATEKISQKPKLIATLEKVKIIEELTGEVGIQINLSLSAFHKDIYLKTINFEHKRIKIDNKSYKGNRISVKILNEPDRDIITECVRELKLEQNLKNLKQKKKEELDYYIKLYTKGEDIRLDNGGNYWIPDDKSFFEKKVKPPVPVGLIETLRYPQFLSKKEIQSLKIESGSTKSITIFVFIYGALKEDLTRNDIPKKNWRLFIEHSFGKIKKEIKGEIISYSHLLNFDS